MARSRSFVPNFDRLGLRIAPSGLALARFATDGYCSSLPPDDSNLPGSGASIEDTISWDMNQDCSSQTLNRKESYLASVDWMLPLTPTTTDN